MGVCRFSRIYTNIRGCAVEIVCISDTHGLHHQLDVPNSRIIVHTGDFSNRGGEAETDNFLQWYSELPYKYKLLIAGNHDFFPYLKPDEFRQKCHTLGITYLEDSWIVIEGIKFYGTPWVPTFYDWAFMESETELAKRYSRIPSGTQVLLTHGPALWTLDEVPKGHAESSALLDRIVNLPNLTHHIFGHIHEGRGKLQKSHLSVNAACVGKWYDALPAQSIYVKPNLNKSTL